VLLFLKNIMRRPWGNREFRVNDDWGNQLKFTEPLVESPNQMGLSSNPIPRVPGAECGNDGPQVAPLLLTLWGYASD
jgi:hypothetical protein